MSRESRDISVLAVEDEAVDALMIRRAFKKANLADRLHLLSDGDSAVAYLKGDAPFADRVENPLPSLILLDLKLPRRSGLEVLEWVREQPGLKRIPIVILTSSAQSADINKAYDLGANSYLVKPVDFNSLLELMKGLGFYWLTLNQKPEIESA